MVRNSQRTLYNVDLHLHQILGKDYEPIENTTLNEKFQVLPNDKLPAGIYPKLQYFAIGCGGNVVMEDVSTYTYNEHLPIDAALFQHIPFIMRNLTDGDLTAEEKKNYRLRVIQNFNGINYACYYLKVFPSWELKPTFYLIRTMESGESVSSPTLSALNLTNSSVLNPKPVNRNITFENQNTLGFVTKMAKITFSLTPTELEEIKKVLEIMNLTDKIITEIGLVTGHDKTIGQDTEVTCAQIAMHIGVSLDLAIELAKETTLIKSIEIGGGEPYVN